MGNFTDWFSRSYKGIIIGLLAVLAATMVVLAMQHVDSSHADAGATARPAPTFAAEKRPVAVFIGDSYTAGAGSTAPSKAFPSLLGRGQGWQVENLGRGGTGYTATATQNAAVACGLDVCPNYSGMIADLKKASPDIIVVSGGRNDVAAAPADEQRAVSDFFASLSDAAPAAKVLVTSPLWDDDAAPSSLERIADDVRSAAAATNARYLDIGQPLSARADLLSDDGVHPNDAGHAAIAAAIAEAIGKQ